MGKSKTNTIFKETESLKIKQLSFLSADNKRFKSVGKTGSQALKDSKGIQYQVKPSILDSASTRRIKARNLDQENFGELIAASVGRAVTNSDDNLELVPMVYLVYDMHKKRCEIASRYLRNASTLDKYHEEYEAALESSYINFDNRSKEGALNIGSNSLQDKIFRQDLALCIAASILNDDHDVSPSNMMILSNKDNARIARIDFGHSFNDLLRGPKSFGGQLRNKNNNVLDFLNRNTLSNLNPNNQETKLWRSYYGLIPSPEMIFALKFIGDSSNITQGLNYAKSAFIDLINQLEQNIKENHKVIAHIKRSLNSINKNIGGKKIEIISDKFFVQFFTNLDEHYKNNQKHMIEVAQLMELQLKIDEMLLNIKNKEVDNQYIAKIWQAVQKKYNSISKIVSIKAGQGKIEWIKNNKNSLPFKGDLYGYVRYKSKELKINIHLDKAFSILQ